MNLAKARRQMSGQPELSVASVGEARVDGRRDEADAAVSVDQCSGNHGGLDIEAVVQRDNLFRALRRVQQNRGRPGVDGMTTEQLPTYLRANWPQVRAELLAGTYRPCPVLRREIPKSGGGTRQLGIPTVLDRLIQQAILQVLQPRFDPTFSDHSYGFRPGRSAHSAVKAAQRFVQEGRRVVVDVDLEKFFDRVNHDVLMGKLAARIEDKRLLGLLRGYLDSGVMVDGVVFGRQEGTPQGGPLSPLLANVMLDEVDQELERRGHAFARYADDLNVYVRSKRAGERVMQLLRKLYGKLRLRINEAKSAVAHPKDRRFLGFNIHGSCQLRVAPKAFEALADKVRALTNRSRGRSLSAVVNDLRPLLLGWKNYFQIAESRTKFRAFDQWIRHRLRTYQIHLWRHKAVVYRELVKRGVYPSWAAYTANFATSWWRCGVSKGICIGMPSAYFDSLGLPRLGT